MVALLRRSSPSSSYSSPAPHLSLPPHSRISTLFTALALCLGPFPSYSACFVARPLSWLQRLLCGLAPTLVTALAVWLGPYPGFAPILVAAHAVWLGPYPAFSACLVAWPLSWLLRLLCLGPFSAYSAVWLGPCAIFRACCAAWLLCCLQRLLCGWAGPLCCFPARFVRPVIPTNPSSQTPQLPTSPPQQPGSPTLQPSSPTPAPQLPTTPLPNYQPSCIPTTSLNSPPHPSLPPSRSLCQHHTPSSPQPAMSSQLRAATRCLDPKTVPPTSRPLPSHLLCLSEMTSFYALASNPPLEPSAEGGDDAPPCDAEGEGRGRPQLLQSPSPSPSPYIYIQMYLCIHAHKRTCVRGHFAQTRSHKWP